MSINWSEHLPRITAEVENINDLEKLRELTRQLVTIISSAERLFTLQDEKEDKFKMVVLTLQACGNKAISAAEHLIAALQENDIDVEEIAPSIYQALQDSKESFSIEFPF